MKNSQQHQQHEDPNLQLQPADPAAGVTLALSSTSPQEQRIALADSLTPSGVAYDREVEMVALQSSTSAAAAAAGRGKASWWRKSQLRRFVLRLPQQRSFSCQFDSSGNVFCSNLIRADLIVPIAGIEPPPSVMKQLQERLAEVQAAHAAAAAEVKGDASHSPFAPSPHRPHSVLSQALNRHHEGAHRELQVHRDLPSLHLPTNTSLQLSDKSTRALTMHIETLQVIRCFNVFTCMRQSQLMQLGATARAAFQQRSCTSRALASMIFRNNLRQARLEKSVMHERCMRAQAVESLLPPDEPIAALTRRKKKFDGSGNLSKRGVLRVSSSSSCCSRFRNYSSSSSSLNTN
jgi:hypothetical protein